MRNLVTPLVAFLLMLASVPAWADGLLYQLPEDGTWVQFDSKVIMTRGDQMRNATGQLRMASVGTASEDGKPCRWIEFKFTLKMDDKERTIVAKVLVPEDQLKEGQKPVDNRVGGWIRMGDNQNVVALNENNLGPIPAFMANPLADVKPLEAEVVKSSLGELSCAGLTGRTEFSEGTATNKVTYRTRRHEKAPFGVVTSQLKIDVERDGAVTQSLDLTLTITDSGKMAKSELPENN